MISRYWNLKYYWIRIKLKFQFAGRRKRLRFTFQGDLSKFPHSTAGREGPDPPVQQALRDGRELLQLAAGQELPSQPGRQLFPAENFRARHLPSGGEGDQSVTIQYSL